MSYENVHHYGQLRLVEKNGYYHVYHGENRLNDKGLLDLSRAYAWASANHPELTVEKVSKKREAEWGDDGFDYHNYYAGGQP